MHVYTHIYHTLGFFSLVRGRTRCNDSERLLHLWKAYLTFYLHKYDLCHTVFMNTVWNACVVVCFICEAHLTYYIHKCDMCHIVFMSVKGLCRSMLHLRSIFDIPSDYHTHDCDRPISYNVFHLWSILTCRVHERSMSFTCVLYARITFDIPYSWMSHAYVVVYFTYEAHWHTVLVRVAFSIYVRIYKAYLTYRIHDCDMPISNRVATISRLLKIIGLFCRISSLLQGSFAKATCNLYGVATISRLLTIIGLLCKKAL